MVEVIISNAYEGMPVVFLYIWPAFVLPIILGPIIPWLYREELGKLAAWFTLKPILATVLWVTTLIWLGNGLGLNTATAEVLSLIPAIALTGVIIWRFKDSFKTDAGVVSVFLGIDALRWLNTLAWMRIGGHIPLLVDPFYVLGLILPNAYAVLAFTIISLRSRQRRLHA